MADNQCLLTPKGIEARDALLKFLYPKGINRINLSTITEIDRGQTIPKIVRTPQSEPLQRQKIEQFFEKIFEELVKILNEDESGIKRKARAKSLLEQYATSTLKNKYFCPSDYISECRTNTSASQVRHGTKNISIEQEISEALLSLNYSEETNLFSTQLNLNKKICAFALQANRDDEENSLQYYLAKRLSHFFVDPKNPKKENTRFIPIKISSYLRSQGNLCLWREIFRYFGESSLSEPSIIKEAILSACKTQVIVFVFYRFSSLGRHLPEFMNEFWYPLADRIAEENLCQSLVLFVMGDHTLSSDIKNDHKYSPYILPVLNEIKGDDIEKNWILTSEFFRLQKRCINESRQTSLDKLRNLGDTTYHAVDAMELIGEALLGTPQELEKFAKYWKLSGD